MNQIIQKAIEGGWVKSSAAIDIGEERDKFIPEAMVCDPSFWQALHKSCNWDNKEGLEEYKGKRRDVPGWEVNAMEFHRINLTEGWNSAVEWLENLIK